MRARLLSQLGIPVLLLLAAGCDAADPLGTEMLSFRRTESPTGTSVVVVAYNHIDVSWQDNSPNETGFELQRGPAVAGPFAFLVNRGAGVISFADFGVSASTQYCYRVRAYRTTGKNTTYSDFSNVACGTTLALPVPAAPSGVNAVPSYSYAIALSWADNSNDENGFRVEFSLNAGTSWQSAGSNLPAGSTAFTHWISALDQTVCYRVMAFNNLGNSPPSNVDCTAQPIAPNPLSANGVAGPAIDLAWPDLSAVEDGYEVRRAGSDGQWSTVVVLSAGSTSYHDAGIAAGIRYSYSVAATKDGGYSDFSSASAMSVNAPPSAPTAINLFPQGSSAISVNWVAQTDNVERFRIERSTDGGVNWSTAGEVFWNENWFWEGVQSEQTYCYRVVAVNSAGEAASSFACAMTLAGPTTLEATPVDGGSIALSWTDNSNNEDGYEVWQVYQECSYYYYYYPYCYTYYITVAALPANRTSYQHTGLDPSTFYTYVVVARKDGVSTFYSDVSNEAGSYPGPIIP